MKSGDYVEIIKGVWDANMPKDRRDGLIVEIVGEKRDQVTVMFSNSVMLKFHKSQVSVLQNICTVESTKLK
jgi:hypothetical protein